VSVELTAIDTLAAGWSAAMVRACWEGGMVIALVWLLDRALPRLRPGLRCWLWRLASLKLLVALFWATPVALPLLPPASSPAAEGVLGGVGEPPGPAVQPVHFRPPSPVRPVRPEFTTAARSGVSALILVVWGVGVIGCGCRLFGAWRRMQRLQSEWEPAREAWLTVTCTELEERMRLDRPPRLMAAANVARPMLVGAVRPVVALPPAFLTHCTPPEQRLILAHELAHLKRRDLLWGWLPALARALFFFHPLVWLAGRQWRLAHEMACDELALMTTRAPAGQYAGVLLKMAAQPPAGTGGLVAVGVVESYRSLERRLSAMKWYGSYSRRRLLIAGAAVTMFGTLSIVPWRVTAQEATGPRSGDVRMQWEDVLLLEALRYLRLTPAQLGQILPLAEGADMRLARLRDTEVKTLADLERIARQHRAALLAGRRGSAKEQSDALLQERAMKQRRAQAEEEIVGHVTPRLARSLTREQLTRIYLLTLGEPPRQESPSPALLDPGAGFVLGEEKPATWDARQAAARQLRAAAEERRAAAAAGATRQSGGGRETPVGLELDVKPVAIVELRGDNLVIDGENVPIQPSGAGRSPTLQQLPEAVLNYTRRRQLRGLPPSTDPPAWQNSPSDQELQTALRLFVQRAFLSPRLKPVLEARMQRPGAGE
jgi:beta-lactamase regulating signal transducer with metallopeptidase domain